MSYKKYVESKNKIKISHEFQNYKENLQANLIKLLYRNNADINGIKRNIINILDVSKQLSELKYPKSEEYKIALCSANSKKISHANSALKEWAENHNINKTIFNNIQTEVYYYQTKLHEKQLTAYDIDKIVENSLMQSKSVLDEMSINIQLALQKVPWKHHEIVVEAIYPKENLVVSEAKVKIGDSYFLYEKTNLGFDIKECHDLNENTEALVDKLKVNKYNPIVTLYMIRPVCECAVYEKAKRELSLGMTTILSNNIEFIDQPIILEGFDTWKIKLEKKYIVEKQNEYCILKDDIPIKWIERINEQ